MRLPWSFPVRLGGSRGGGLPDQRPLAQFPLWPSLFASMRFMGLGEYRRPRERALRVPSVSVVPLATPDAKYGGILFAISNSRREEERRLTAPSRRCWRLRQSVREAYSGEQAKEGGW